jgi:hypothetical protein
VKTLVLAGVLGTLVALAHASPPDPTWIPGLYDNADGDDVVAFIVDADGAADAGAPVAPMSDAVVLVHAVIATPAARAPTVDQPPRRAGPRRAAAARGCDSSVSARDPPLDTFHRPRILAPYFTKGSGEEYGL